MAPLIALIVTYAAGYVVFRNRPDHTLAGRLALAAMLGVTGVAHFTATDALASMVPPIVPYPVAVVHVTGIAELLFAVLLVARPSPLLGWILVAFLVAVLPANIYAAVYEVGLGGRGAAYLWFRVPLQIFFIAWAAYFTGAVQVRTSPPRGFRLAIRKTATQESKQASALK